MYYQSFSYQIGSFILSVGLLSMGVACEMGVDEAAVVETDAASQSQSQPLEDLDPLVVGDNRCYMVQAYFPTDALRAILPGRLSIPDPSIMATYYPETALKDDAHPFMMSFCHGSNIHDVFTNINVPEQEELLFAFPVLYAHNDGNQYLCSYVPVLYLDSLMGVVGGLVFGLRKEFHPNMEHGETATGKWWRLDPIISASFTKNPSDRLQQLPSFIEQTFANPFVTLSYPTPFAQLVFYEAQVYPTSVMGASNAFYWNYKGTTVQHGADTRSVFSEYWFNDVLA